MPSLADATMKAAGIAFVTSGGLALFMQRAADSDHPGEWCFPGGGIEDGETANEAAAREAFEEAGVKPGAALSTIAREVSDEGVDFTTFMSTASETFDPTLNDEHVEFTWAPLSEPPEPLHPGVEAVLPKLKEKVLAGAQDAIAFDRAASVRTVDRDGHMHVSTTNISKATVNPYVGREIPDHEALGLDADKVYQLLRDPDELKKAAASFKNKPLLLTHKPVSADDHAHELTVGSVGEPEFDGSYLKASLVVWDGAAIKAIESRAQRELSCGYRYRADMTPGTFNGIRYDGVMRDIQGNHVALVKEGRAGPDVVVNDSKLHRFIPFKGLTMKTTLTRGGVAAQTAIALFLKPKLAQDAKVDLAPILKGVTSKTFKAKKAGIAVDLKKATTGKLAADANIDDVTELLDALEDVIPIEVAPAEPVATITPTDDDPAATDASTSEIKAFLAGKLSDEDLAQVLSMLGDDDPVDPAAMDTKRRLQDEKTRRAVAEATKNTVTKPAMDAAIAAAAKAATDNATKTQREIREAERAVRPYVGDLAVAMDSAEDVYRTALTSMGHGEAIAEVKEVAALKAILAVQPLPGSQPKRATTVAMDTASAKGFAERYPQAARIGLA